MPFDSQVLAAILSPVITALLGAAAVALQGLQRAKRADGERARIVSQAAQEAAFLNSWLSAHAQLELSPEQRRAADERVADDLERLYATLRSVDIGTDNRSRMLSATRVLRGMFLLELRRPWAKIVRIAYYLALVPVLIMPSLIVVVVDFDSGYPLIGDIIFKLSSSVLMTVLLMLPAVGLWCLARALDRRPNDGDQPSDVDDDAATPAASDSPDSSVRTADLR